MQNFENTLFPAKNNKNSDKTSPTPVVIFLLYNKVSV